MQAGAVSGPSEARLQAAGRGFRLTRWIGQPIGKAGKPKAAGAGGGGGSQAVGTLCDRLWYERNAIYAAKGYCFQTERARRAFPNSCFPPWGKLNRAEQRKVDRIRARERALGCP
ncbi:MAG: YARHG domain-containing protein [Alphaproteobacteria bacterium]|nr:MAG: YARHG domain-containing protein [Alphaproteobacteria bacterium]